MNAGASDQEDEENTPDLGIPKPLVECYPTTTAAEVSVVGVLCDICLNEYKSDDKLRTIPCLHRFHTKCIDKWLKVNIQFIRKQSKIINYFNFFLFLEKLEMSNV